MDCNNCGNKIEKNQTFCSNCGTKIKGNNVNSKNENKNENTSLVLGIVCLMTSFFLNILAIIPGIISIVYANKYKKESGKLGVGFILSIIGMIISFLMFLLILVIIFFAFFIVTKTDKCEYCDSNKEPNKIIKEEIRDFDELNNFTAGTKFEYEDNEWTILYDDETTYTAISNNILLTTKDYFKITEEDINLELTNYKQNLDEEVINIRLLSMDDINKLCTNTYDQEYDKYTLNNCPKYLKTNKKTLTNIPIQHQKFTITADSTIQNYYYLSDEFDETTMLSSVIKLDKNLFNFRPVITLTK